MWIRRNFASKTQRFGLSAYGRQRECNVSTWHGGPTGRVCTPFYRYQNNLEAHPPFLLLLLLLQDPTGTMTSPYLCSTIIALLKYY
jgi:hypothetical protein